MDANIGSSPRKVEECRICQDEDEESNMEVPCFCRGSLKYAHRKCVQRWCNEKGDIVCEICRQLFKPDYTAPPPLFHYGGIPMNFRGNWEISRRDLHSPQFISMGSTDRNLLYRNFDDYPEPTSRSLICCRIFIILVILRHTLPFIIYGAGEYSISLVMLLILRTIGILLPIYIMVKALTAIHHRRNRQAELIYATLPLISIPYAKAELIPTPSFEIPAPSSSVQPSSLAPIDGTSPLPPKASSVIDLCFIQWSGSNILKIVV
ncbi:hypothetical protein DH2020_040871 [Rehmannia glutinosa]|uniref:RING-CH-type domain-containing protein n=1 Tax=Rehmannia glutinosa TaxID=99300 RepID=A0ABR0URZ2_REHGL